MGEDMRKEASKECTIKQVENGFFLVKLDRGMIVADTLDGILFEAQKYFTPVEEEVKEEEKKGEGEAEAEGNQEETAAPAEEEKKEEVAG
jgi:hypothetical protein